MGDIRLALMKKEDWEFSELCRSDGQCKSVCRYEGSKKCKFFKLISSNMQLFCNVSCIKMYLFLSLLMSAPSQVELSISMRCICSTKKKWDKCLLVIWIPEYEKYSWVWQFVKKIQRSLKRNFVNDLHTFHLR